MCSSCSRENGYPECSWMLITISTAQKLLDIDWLVLSNPIQKILVKTEIFPKVRDEHKKYFETTNFPKWMDAHENMSAPETAATNKLKECPRPPQTWLGRVCSHSRCTWTYGVLFVPGCSQGFPEILERLPGFPDTVIPKVDTGGLGECMGRSLQIWPFLLGIRSISGVYPFIMHVTKSYTSTFTH